MRLGTCTLVFSLAAAALCAQKVGEPAPEVTWAKTWNFGPIAAGKLSDLRGSAVLLEFWATWCGPCKQQIPHLNELFAKKAEQGLVVVGVSDETAAEIGPFVEANKMAYPVASAATPDYRMDGIPHAFLIDKEGKLVWRGHPASLDELTITRALSGAKPATVARGLEDVHALRKEGKQGAAYHKAKELLAKGELSEPATAQAKDWVAAMETFVKESMAAVADPAVQKDVYTYWTKLEPVATQYDGVPGAEGAKAKLDALLADAKNKKEIEAGGKIAQAKKHEAALEFDAAHALYKEVASRFSTLKSGKAADAAYRAIEKDGKLGYTASCGYCKAGGVACPQHSKTKKKK